MEDVQSQWKKLNKQALRLTWRKWGLYDDAKDPEGVAAALNEALQRAAQVLWAQVAAAGTLRGAKLEDAIMDALMARWTGTARRHRQAGAEDTEVMERAAAALRKFLRDNQPTAEGNMRDLLNMVEAKRTIPRELPVTEAVLKALMEVDKALTAEVTDLAEKDEELRRAYYAFTDGLGGFQRALNDYRKRVRAAWNQK